MTDQEIIEKIAQWMGWKIENPTYKTDTVWVSKRLGDLETWNPLDNIADAWEVFERLITSDGDTIDICGCIGKKRTDWSIELSDDTEVFAKTAPRAICKACLKIIESREEEVWEKQ